MGIRIFTKSILTAVDRSQSQKHFKFQRRLFIVSFCVFDILKIADERNIHTRNNFAKQLSFSDSRRLSCENLSEVR